jgi:hypothetical protein
MASCWLLLARLLCQGTFVVAGFVCCFDLGYLGMLMHQHVMQDALLLLVMVRPTVVAGPIALSICSVYVTRLHHGYCSATAQLQQLFTAVALVS